MYVHVHTIIHTYTDVSVFFFAFRVKPTLGLFFVPCTIHIICMYLHVVVDILCLPGPGGEEQGGKPKIIII